MTYYNFKAREENKKQHYVHGLDIYRWVWKLEMAMAPLLSHLMCNQAPNCAPVNVSSFGDCLWTIWKKRKNQKKKKEKSLTCLPAFLSIVILLVCPG